jgi:hypothetical protein
MVWMTHFLLRQIELAEYTWMNQAMDFLIILIILRSSIMVTQRDGVQSWGETLKQRQTMLTLRVRWCLVTDTMEIRCYWNEGYNPKRNRSICDRGANDRTPSANTQIIHSDHPQADFKSGYDHGVADASVTCNDPRIPCMAYVWKSPNGFINQTNDLLMAMSPDSVRLQE